MEIEGWIREHEREMVEDIRRLVRIPSVSRKQEGEYPYGKDCAEAALCLRRMAEGYGLETEDCGGSVSGFFMEAGSGRLKYGIIWMWCRRGTVGFIRLLAVHRLGII